MRESDGRYPAEDMPTIRGRIYMRAVRSSARVHGPCSPTEALRSGHEKHVLCAHEGKNTRRESNEYQIRTMRLRECGLDAVGEMMSHELRRHAGATRL
jgi:hypothetical protein